MSTNQYHGKEETDKLDFGQKNIVEQKNISGEKTQKDEAPLNEELALLAKKKIDQERARNIH